MPIGSLLGSLGGAAGAANPVGMGIAAGAGLLKAGLGFLQQAKGKKMLKKTVDPGYKIPKGYGENLAQAEQMAKSGLGAQQYNQAQQNIGRNVATGVRALSRSSNPSAGVAGLVRSQNEATMGLDISNASARRQNILQAMGARREMAGQQLAQQQYAQNRYFDKVNEAQARIGAGTQNMFGGLSDIGTAGIMSGMGGNKAASAASGVEDIGSYAGNIGKNLSTGQFGTRLGGGQGGGFGAGMLPGLPFIPKQTGKFIPKSFPSSSANPYNL
jgi:hypothetical protein